MKNILNGDNFKSSDKRVIASRRRSNHVFQDCFVAIAPRNDAVAPKLGAVPNFVFLLIVFLLMPGLAQAEVATLKNALIWSADKSSSYSLPKLNQGFYTSDEFVATAGQITSITANWKSAGKVSLEVSADNGLHYQSVVNGQPLKSGFFISGNRLRFRAQPLSEDAKLFSVKISYTDSTGVRGSFGEPSLSEFNYRKKLTVKNSLSYDLYNYQIKLKIAENESIKDADINCSGKIKADFKDIRFSAADKETPLAYYVETVEGIVPDRTATVWVKVPQIPKLGSVPIYLYYGNSDAEDLSNPDETFDFYEDFQDAILDDKKWVVQVEPKGSLALDQGNIKLDAAEIVTKEFKFKEGLIEYSCELESGFENSLGIRNNNNKTYDNPDWTAYSSAYKGAEHCIAMLGIVKANDAKAMPAAGGEKYIYKLALDAGKFNFQRFDQTGSTLQAETVYQPDAAPAAGYISLRSGGDGSGRNIMSFGTIRARKSVATPPEVEASDQELVELPVFDNTILSTDGGVILKDGTKDGYYLSQDISASGVSTRIMIPTWETKDKDNSGLQVDISADGGEAYKESCESGKFYYASKKDFSEGSNLKFRVDFEPSSFASSTSQLLSFSLDFRPGRITLIWPNGGEDWAQEAQKEISWSALEYEKDYPVNIEYSTDGGKNFTVIAAKAPNSGEYLWKVDASETQKGLIKVSDALAAQVFDISDKPFTISEPKETSEYLLEGEGLWNNPAAWAGSKVPTLNSEVTIAGNATIYATEPVSFRSLTIGDGTGRKTTRVVLKEGLNKGCREIIIRRGGELIQENSTSQYLSGNLTIKNGGILTHSPNTNKLEYKIDFSAENITVEPGSKITADKKGYAGGSLLSPGFDMGTGSEKEPSQLGAGGAGGAKLKGGAGGGAIRLDARESFLIYGTVSALGEDVGLKSKVKDEAVGGGGGSIYLSSPLFGGDSAKVLATGGAGNKGGAGGRIYIKGSGKVSGKVDANAGAGVEEKGKAGSIIFE